MPFRAVETNGCDHSPFETVPTESLVHFKNSPIHGMGGFARAAIPSETRILEYLGRKIDKHESLRQCELENPCIFCLDEQFDLDGNVDWNPARFLNHCCSPNAEAQAMDGGIWIVALRHIRAGEEITFNYNYDLQDYREHPCSCGSPDCCGYIVAEEFFSAVRKAINEGGCNSTELAPGSRC
jgi:SET domain-containing protein